VSRVTKRAPICVASGAGKRFTATVRARKPTGKRTEKFVATVGPSASSSIESSHRKRSTSDWKYLATRFVPRPSPVVLFMKQKKTFQRRIYELHATAPFAEYPWLQRIFAAYPPVPVYAIDHDTLPAILKVQANNVPVGLFDKGLVLVGYDIGTRRGGRDGFQLAREYLIKNPRKAEILGKSARRRMYGSTVSYPSVPTSNAVGVELDDFIRDDVQPVDRPRVIEMADKLSVVPDEFMKKAGGPTTPYYVVSNKVMERFKRDHAWAYPMITGYLLVRDDDIDMKYPYAKGSVRRSPSFF
jgi:hypothetical protein